MWRQRSASLVRSLATAGGGFRHAGWRSRVSRGSALPLQPGPMTTDEREVIRASATPSRGSQRPRTHARAIFALTAVASVGAFVWLAVTAKHANDAAEAARREAIAVKLVIQSRAILEGQSATTTDRALLLAAAAYRLRPNGEAYGGLQYALDATPRLVKVVSFPDRLIMVTRDGRTAVTTSDTTLRLWEVATGQPRGGPMRGYESWRGSIAFSPDGTTLVSRSDDTTFRLWDIATGQPRGGPLQGQSVAFSPERRDRRHRRCLRRDGAPVGRRDRPAARRARARAHGRGAGRHVQPRGPDARLRRQQRDVALLGRRDRPATRRTCAGAYGQGGVERRVQPRRPDAGLRGRRRDAAPVGRGDRPAARRAPARTHGRGRERGVQP